MSIRPVGGQSDIPDAGQADAPAAAEATAPAATTRSTGTGVVKLTKAHEDKILGDYHKLKAKGEVTKHPAHMPLGIQFASIEAGSSSGSISFGHHVTLLVPEGPLVPPRSH